MNLAKTSTCTLRIPTISQKRQLLATSRASSVGDRSVVAFPIAGTPTTPPMRTPRPPAAKNTILHPASAESAYQRRRQHRPYRRSRIDDPHRGRSLAPPESTPQPPRRRRKRAPLAHPQQTPRHQQQPESRRQPMQRARPRPPHHDQDETPPRAQQIQQPPAPRIQAAYGMQKRQLQPRKLLIR